MKITFRKLFVSELCQITFSFSSFTLTVSVEEALDLMGANLCKFSLCLPNEFDKLLVFNRLLPEVDLTMIGTLLTEAVICDGSLTHCLCWYSFSTLVNDSWRIVTEKGDILSKIRFFAVFSVPRIFVLRFFLTKIGLNVRQVIFHFAGSLESWNAVTKIKESDSKPKSFLWILAFF